MYRLLLPLIAVLVFAGAATGQQQDLGTWDVSGEGTESGIESVTVKREGSHGQPWTEWTIYADVHGSNGAPLGTMEFKWPSEFSSDLRWDKPAGESLIYRRKADGLARIEFIDLAAGEHVVWQHNCDMMALQQAHRALQQARLETRDSEGKLAPSDIEAMQAESLECGHDVTLTGTDIKLSESLEHFRPRWAAMLEVENLVRTRFGFSDMQLAKERRAKRQADRAAKPGSGGLFEPFLKFNLCPSGFEKTCPFPISPTHPNAVVGEGFGFSESACPTDAVDEADLVCLGVVQDKCCAYKSPCTITNFLCGLGICHCLAVAAFWDCVPNCV